MQGQVFLTCKKFEGSHDSSDRRQTHRKATPHRFLSRHQNHRPLTAPRFFSCFKLQDSRKSLFGLHRFEYYSSLYTRRQSLTKWLSRSWYLIIGVSIIFISTIINAYLFFENRSLQDTQYLGRSRFSKLMNGVPIKDNC